jgi:hypothetical protein
MSRIEGKQAAETNAIGGVAGWLIARLAQRRRPAHRLEVLERITLAPRQSLALIEAEGRRLLVATSAEGPPAFYNLDGQGNPDGRANIHGHGTSVSFGAEPRLRRISW